MPSYQEVLQAITGMQQNAQASLPVIPNNGDPRGANNMPAATAAVMPSTTGANKFPWLNPSPSMDVLHQLLSRPLMQGYQGPAPGTDEFRAARQAGETPIRDYLQEQRAAQGLPPRPVLPTPGNGNTGIVPPHMSETAPRPMNLPILPYSR